MQLGADGKLIYIIEVDDKGTPVLRKFSGNVDTLGKHTGTAATQSKKLNGSLFEMRNLIKTLGGGLLLRQMGKMADTYTSANARLKLVTKSHEELASVQQGLNDLVRETRGDWLGTIDLYARVARSTKGMKIEQQALLDVTRAINQAIIVSGSSQTEADAAITQLSQGMASGTLRGEELNSVLEQTPRIAEMIAAGLDITIGQLRKWGAEGKLTTEKIITAIRSQSAVVDAEFKSMPATMAQGMKQINNELMKLIGSEGEQSKISISVAEGLLSIADGIKELRPLIGFLVDNLDVIGVALAGIGVQALAGSVGLKVMASAAVALRRALLPLMAAEAVYAIYKEGNNILELHQAHLKGAAAEAERLKYAKGFLAEYAAELKAIGINTADINPADAEQVARAIDLLAEATHGAALYMQDATGSATDLREELLKLGTDTADAVDPALTALEKLSSALQSQADKQVALRAKVYASTGGAAAGYFDDQVKSLRTEVDQMLRANISVSDVGDYLQKQMETLSGKAADRGASLQAGSLASMAAHAHGEVATLAREIANATGRNRALAKSAQAVDDALSATADKMKILLPAEQAAAVNARITSMRDSLKDMAGEAEISATFDTRQALLDVDNIQLALSSIPREIVTVHRIVTSADGGGGSAARPNPFATEKGSRATGGQVPVDGLYYLHGGERVEQSNTFNIYPQGTSERDWRHLTRTVIAPELARMTR